MGPFNRSAKTQQQNGLSPQRDTKMWNRVKPSGNNPPVTGMPPEVEAVMHLRRTSVKYDIQTPQYIYF